jgi:tight adherence protein C
MEAAIGLTAATAVLSALRAIRRRDPVVAQRVAALVRTDERRPRPRRVSLAGFLTAAGRKVPGDREALQRLIAASGSDASADTVLGTRIVLALLGMLLGLEAGSLAPLAAAALAVGGYQVPVLMLKARLENRRDEVAAALPDAVELLAVCTRAGLNIPLGLNRVASRFSGVLGDEMRRAVNEMELGVPRSEALSSLATRVALDEADAFVGALLKADRFGVGIADSMEGFAADLRGRRRRKVEEQARRAPVKILFPLVFLILPAFVLLTVVPLLLGTFATLGF